MNHRVCGLDCGAGFVVATILTHRPDNPREFFRSSEFEFVRCDANRLGVQQLLSLQPDLCILEPTGSYSKFWRAVLEREGIPYRLINQSKVKDTRKAFGLPSKNDPADALLMTIIYFDHQHDPSWWIDFRHPRIEKMRELLLQLEALNRAQNPIINRAKQHLSYEFPEVMHVNSSRHNGKLDPDNPPPLWAWLGEMPVTKRTQNRYDRIYAATEGVGLSDFTRRYGKLRCYLHSIEAMVEQDLIVLLKHPSFDSYQQVFDHFGFGYRVRAAFLSQVYPFENFLRLDGRQDIRFSQGVNTAKGKATKKNYSLRKFKHALGLGATERSSGDFSSWQVSGPGICRMFWWRWVFTRVEPVRSRPSSPLLLPLYELCDLTKARYPNKMPGDAIARLRFKISAKATEILYKLLLQNH